MVILGLGSNVGDRLTNFRKALELIKQLPGLTVKQVSPIYFSDALLPDNAPPEWDRPYLNLAVLCDTALEPETLLHELKEIEWSIGRKPEMRHWGPRILDIDILIWDDLVIQTENLTVPHESLQERPFALWPVVDLAPFWKFPLPGPNHGKTAAEIAEPWGSRFSGKAPFHTRQICQRIDTPQLVGIINVTPDSFSDGGKFLTAEHALHQALHLVYAGAEVIDIGGESTAPNAQYLDPKTEWQRLEPVLSALKEIQDNFFLPPKISLDTRHADVAARALELGVNWINDVSGLQDPAMREVVATSGADCVVMHHVSIPADKKLFVPRDQDILRVVYDWADQQFAALEKAGIKRDKIIFDPGIGFGKVPEQSLALIKHIQFFESLGTRILVGHSRKSFLSFFTENVPQERDIETLAVALYLAQKQVDYLRVHNVEMCARGINVTAALPL